MSSIFALFLFQMVFMDTTATIPTAPIAERWKFESYRRLRALHDARLSRCSQLGLGRRVPGKARRSLTSAAATVGAHVNAVVSPGRGDGARAESSGSGQAKRDLPGNHIPWSTGAGFILASGGSGSTRVPPSPANGLRIGVVASIPILATAVRRFSCDDVYVDHVGQADVLQLANGMLGGISWPSPPPAAFVTSAVRICIGVVAGILFCR